MRILKRPMFQRGGPSFQSQGTGITSPYDTPRKNYQIGSWGEWEEQTRKATKDPRGDWSYAAEGFSALANPYKKSGITQSLLRQFNFKETHAITIVILDVIRSAVFNVAHGILK